MKKYTRVSYDVRCQIDALLQVKLSIPEIAKHLGFNKSTIYRELRRNNSRGPYSPTRAEEFARERYRRCRKAYSINHKVKDYIDQLLIQGWSPQQISGRLKKEKLIKISHQTIYSFVNKDKQTRAFLRRYNKRGAGRTLQRRRIRAKVNGFHISERPRIVEQRRRIGDWERDTMHTLNGVQLLVCIDRKSRFIKIERVDKRTTMEIGYQTERLIKETGKRAYTVTNDNGGDFKGKSNIRLPIYFCRPMKPQERGSVENVIGLIREYIKRKTDVRDYTKDDFLHLENILNFRPRKVLDYRTPYEVYYNEKVALASLI